MNESTADKRGGYPDAIGPNSRARSPLRLRQPPSKPAADNTPTSPISSAPPTAVRSS
jgi:hypothetical protein